MLFRILIQKLENKNHVNSLSGFILTLFGSIPSIFSINYYNNEIALVFLSIIFFLFYILMYIILTLITNGTFKLK